MNEMTGLAAFFGLAALLIARIAREQQGAGETQKVNPPARSGNPPKAQ